MRSRTDTGIELGNWRTGGGRQARHRERRGAIETVPSEANFVLAHVGVDDGALAEALARRGLLVRAGGEFGLEGYVRITVGPAGLMRRVASELMRERRGLLSPS